MTAKMMVAQVRSETWFKGKRDERQVQIWTLLDCDSNSPISKTVDYVPSEEEVELMPKDAVLLKPLEFQVRDILCNDSGRLKFIGSVKI